MKNTVVWGVLVLVTFGFSRDLRADLVISQYVETNSGTTPKGIEVWNSGPNAIDFLATNFQVFQGTNGAAPTALVGTLINTGNLASGSVLVIGTSDIGTYLTDNGLGAVPFVNFNFAFNGDDSLELRLGGTVVDVFGSPGNDPGSEWSGSGVSTANQNIALNAGIIAGSTGFTDPSVRFSTISTTPVNVPGGLAGFGVAPVGVPEPTTFGLLGLAGIALVARRSRRS